MSDGKYDVGQNRGAMSECKCALLMRIEVEKGKGDRKATRGPKFGKERGDRDREKRWKQIEIPWFYDHGLELCSRYMQREQSEKKRDNVLEPELNRESKPTA